MLDEALIHFIFKDNSLSPSN